MGMLLEYQASELLLQAVRSTFLAQSQACLLCMSDSPSCQQSGLSLLFFRSCSCVGFFKSQSFILELLVAKCEMARLKVSPCKSEASVLNWVGGGS